MRLSEAEWEKWQLFQIVCSRGHAPRIVYDRASRGRDIEVGPERRVLPDDPLSEAVDEVAWGDAVEEGRIREVFELHCSECGLNERVRGERLFAIQLELIRNDVHQVELSAISGIL